MTNTDIKLTIDFLKSQKEILEKIKTVCILSPTYELSFYEKIFNNIEIKDINSWDLNKIENFKYNLIISHNIFYISKNPQLWIDNVMNSCDYFLLQDILKRKRNLYSEFCETDHDSIRFSFNNHKYYDGETFNLSNIKYKIINGIIYDGEKNEFDNQPKHFACLIGK